MLKKRHAGKCRMADVEGCNQQQNCKRGLAFLIRSFSRSGLAMGPKERSL